MDSPIDHAVGVIVHKKVGDAVAAGEPLCTLLVNEESRLREAETLIRGAYTFGAEPPAVEPLIVERIAAPPRVSPPGNRNA
jgi:pyrimidine-nucleoside phosphorylase